MEGNLNQPAMERLEGRRMMDGMHYTVDAGRANFRFEDGVLYIKGTANEDTLRPNVGGGKLSFDLQTRYGYRSAAHMPIRPTDVGTSVVFSPTKFVPPGYSNAEADLPRLADVKKIIIDAGGSNDLVDVSALSIPAEIYGGDGRDTLLGSQANDTLIGNNGGDEIFDGAGDDVLSGGAGADTLRSGLGRDLLAGGVGEDYLVSKSRKDILDGGEGADAGALAAAPDDVRGVESWSDQTRYQPSGSGGALGSALRLWKDQDGQLRLDTALTLSDSGWAVDWDLLEAGDERIIVQATLYRVGPGYGSAQALTGHKESFKLGAAPRHATISAQINTAIGALVKKQFELHPDFVSGKTLAGEYPPRL